MRSSTLYLRVGFIVLVGIGALIGFVLFLSGANFSNGVELETYFSESAQGLSEGSPVTFLGVTIGRVASIGLVTAEYGQGVPQEIRRATFRQVYVRFVINPQRIGRSVGPANIENAVKVGLRTRIITQGITGISNLGLDFVNPQQFPASSVPWEPRFPYVPSVPSTISQVQSAAEVLAAELKTIDFSGIAESLLGLTRSLQTEIKSGDVHQTFATAAALLQTIQQAVQEAKLPELTASLRRGSDAVGGFAASGKVQALLANADRAASDLAAAGRALPPLITALSQTVGRTDAVSAEFERRMTAILADLQATTSNLRDLTSELRAYPAGTLFGGPPPRGAQERGGGGQ